MPTPLDRSPRLRPSPAFVQQFTMDGRPFVAQDTEPYIQYWLSERYRLLLALFGTRQGLRAEDAVAAWHRLHGSTPGGPEDLRLRRAIDDLHGAGVLVGRDEDTSRYDRRIAADYVAHRPFPAEIARHLVQAAGIGPATRVLDLAGGPGDLALQLAAHSRAVTLLELSRGFTRFAAARARAQGLALRTEHESANRLPQRDEPWDVVTVSQALHWLDDVQVCRGVCRGLADDGSFFVVHSAIELPDGHPLGYLLGHDSVLGAKPRQPFADEVQPLLQRLALLLQALHVGPVQRVDLRESGQGGRAPIGVAGVALFRQRRPFGPGFARGFLTPRHIELTGQAPAAFWQDLQARCAGLPDTAFEGCHRWAVLHFRRGAPVQALPALASAPEQAIGLQPWAAAAG
ncbi:class I SAM-dependent methyltransferase [Aquabacterium sp.]|uniref:class I SAM-dependent methyltransferase n=1 Tax=Aquabacterium sp. TaxID=1872578 RepID=UPI003783218C